MIEGIDFQELKENVLDNMVFLTECNTKGIFNKLEEALIKCSINAELILYGLEI